MWKIIVFKFKLEFLHTIIFYYRIIIDTNIIHTSHKESVGNIIFFFHFNSTESNCFTDKKQQPKTLKPASIHFFQKLRNAVLDNPKKSQEHD